MKIEDTATDAIRTAIARLADLSPALQDFGSAYLSSSLTNQFRSETTPYGENWTPLSRQYLARKKGGGGILWATGRMANSGQMQVDPSQLTISLTDKKASYHQLGTRHLPKRQILPDDRGLPRDLENLSDCLIKHLGM